MTETRQILGMHPFYFNSNPLWDHATGILVLEVASAIPPNANHMLAFEVKNGHTNQANQIVGISVNCPGNTPGCPNAGFKMLDVKCSPSDDADCTPAPIGRTGFKSTLTGKVLSAAKKVSFW